MTRPGSFLRNVLSNWIGIPAAVAYALFITPIVVRSLGQELYGVWSFVNGLLIYSDVLYFGLGSALIKFVAQFRANDDHAGINRMFSIVIAIYSTLGLACFGVMVALSTFVPHAFAQPLSADAARAASATCVLLGAQLCFVFIGSAFSGLMCGHDRYDLVNGIGILAIAIRFIATPALIREAEDPLFRLAALTMSVAALQTFAVAAIAYWYIPRLSIRPARPKLEELRSLYAFGVPSFLIIFGVKLISYTDTTVIGVMLGAASVAIYALPLQLVEYSRAAVGGFTGVFLPRLAVLTTRGDMAGVRESYLNVTRIACFLSAWAGAIVVCLGPTFLNRWVGSSFGTPVHWVLVYLVLAAFGQVLSIHAPLGFYQAMNLVSFPAKVLIFEAVLNLLLSIWLAPRLGITGVALATAIPALLVSTVLLPPYLCRRLGVPLRTFVTASVFPGGLMLVASVIALQLSGLALTAESYPAIVARAMITLPVAVLLFIATFPTDQQRALTAILGLARAAQPTRPTQT